MAFFEEIDGKSGEQLSSAVLRHLLIRSPGLRTAFIDVVSEKSVKRPITIDDQFACFLEQSTWAEDEPDSSRPTGRIDMVVETDDAVVGIENKFNASFQAGQPAKYLADMRKRAEDLTKLREREFMYMVIVLAPESRQTEIERHIGSSGLAEQCCFVSWQNVLRQFDKRRTAIDPGDSYLLGEFEEFIKSSTGFPSYMKRAIPHLRRHWEPRGAKLHRVMRDFLWYIVPEELRVVTRAGFGLDYTGYYISPDSDEGTSRSWIWYGFVSSKAVDSGESSDKAHFMLASPLTLDGDLEQMQDGPLRRCEKVRGWTENDYDCWLLRFDDAWDSPDKWEQPLRPYFLSLSAAFGLSGNSSPGVTA